MTQKINKKVWDWKYGINLSYEKYKDMEVINLNVKDLYLMISEYCMECPLELNSVYYIQTEKTEYFKNVSLEYFKIVKRNDKNSKYFRRKEKRKNPEINPLYDNLCVVSERVSFSIPQSDENMAFSYLLNKNKLHKICGCPNENKVQLFHNEFNMYYPTSSNSELSWNIYLKIYRSYDYRDDYIFAEQYHGTISMDGKYIQCSVYWEKFHEFRTVIFEKLS